jgi:hypothetical protein
MARDFPEPYKYGADRPRPRAEYGGGGGDEKNTLHNSNIQVTEKDYAFQD